MLQTLPLKSVIATDHKNSIKEKRDPRDLKLVMTINCLLKGENDRKQKTKKYDKVLFHSNMLIEKILQKHRS